MVASDYGSDAFFLAVVNRLSVKLLLGLQARADENSIAKLRPH